MVFYPPSWVPKLPFDPPADVTIGQFMLDEQFGRQPLRTSRPPYTCGISGNTYTATEVRHRVEHLAKGIAIEFQWAPNKGSEWEKVIGIFAVNTIDFLTLSWAIHRLSGISSPANAAYSTSELTHQLTSSGAKALFTCIPLLPLALEAAAKSGIPKERVFLLDVPPQLISDASAGAQFKSVNDLIRTGETQPPLESLKWSKGQGQRQCAFLCYSSGTSGLPVPPIMLALVKNKTLLDKFDTSSVEEVFTGAAPLGTDMARELDKQCPTWKIRQGYGLTESSTVLSSTSSHDIWWGSSGSLLPGVQAKIIAPDGNEITKYDTRGELHVKSPSVVLGYLKNEKATKETFYDGWLRTGDEVVIRKGQSGTEHLFIVDRIKELIKVKGNQVAPAELEAFLLTLPDVADAAVIPVPDERAGEVPKAFVAKSASASSRSEEELTRFILDSVEKAKAKYKWLKGGIEFIDVIPKSPSGKILRRLLRDKEREKRRGEGAKL
ncbi:MAG: hypothetical protein M1814_002098 [Vezdaea aestivalis]|nr:MAG: hypothetical protein M1814_002098 [Vezdaea aestivalis]